ncbi:MAG: NHLP bacteriocin export ABC transporter permease/ATPase subunit [Labilithrix sp.]|nr:NHLP bacteriocin export ABC transporter permease/ATPase subunit [Labilithrix sp.]MCW5813430.1 NHLP bacteriocin export ABC transporter permease/ATPase subunit [Labilithrix sp.]
MIDTARASQEEPEVAASLRALFGEACDELRVEGDEPLLLDDPAYVYVTTMPGHQLFCVGWRDGRAVGRRAYVSSVAPGQLLFARAPDANATELAALLLTGPPGGSVLRIPSRLFVEALADPARRASAEGAFDAWITHLVSMLPAAPVPTRCDAVEPGLVLGPQANPLRAARGLVWITLASTPERFGAVRVTEHEDAPRQWPLTESAWVVGGEGATASSRALSSPLSSRGAWMTGARTSTSVELLARDRSTSFADAFYAFVVSVLAKSRAGAEAARAALDGASREAEGELVADALRQLAAVGRGERLGATSGSARPFEHAAEKIAAYLGVAEIHARWPAARAGLGAVQTAIAQMTGVRTRRVLLEGDWHEDDVGPLLGFMLDDGDEVNDERLNPIALLPAKGGYELFDARAGGPRRVTAELAERVHPQAYQFYPPMPDRPLRPLDVLRFSGKRAWRDVAFVLVVGLGLGSFSTLIPLVTGQVFDTIIPGAERNLLLQITAVLIAVYLGQALFEVVRGLAIVRAQTRMDATLEAGVWDRLLSLPLPFFREYAAGDLAARAAGIGAIRDLLAGTAMTALLSGLFSLWNFALLFAIDPGLALAATVLVLVAVVPAAIGTRYGLAQQRAVAAIDGRIGGLLLQLLTGIAKLRVTAAEGRAFAVWARLFARRRDADLGAERVYLRIGLFQSVYPLVCTMVLYWMLAGKAQARVSTGMFLAFASAFGIFLSAALGVVESLLASLAVVPLYERAKPILTQRLEAQGGGERIELKGGIEVSHVSFRYAADGPLILDDVSFQVEPDEFVALVGPSGSGKSTLLRLLLGFEACTEGGVYYDGQALGHLDVRAVRKQIGVVMQNSRVMGGDIYSNIVGATGLSLDEAWNAARSAALDKDIEAMPMGMHTVIAQGGGTLSGGQRQRLLIARSLAADPKIVFFDEATSALDNLTQQIVSESLESLRVTRVVIAHRLSTIRHADKIVVLEKGRVVQMGRFDDLVAVPGPFQRLAARQMV